MTKRQNTSAFLLAIMTPILFAVWIVPHFYRPSEIRSVGGRSFSITNAPLPPYYLQIDDRWKDDQIGGSNEKIEAVGCTLCCVCMSLAQQVKEVHPKELNQQLIAINGYTVRGWLKWKSLSDLYEDQVAVSVPGKPTHKAIEKSLHSNRPVIAKIMLYGSVPHWVLIVGKQETDYVIMNPLDRNTSLQILSDQSDAIHSIRIITVN